MNQIQSDRYKSTIEPANEQMEKFIENGKKMNLSHELVTVVRYYIENKRSSKYRKEECEWNGEKQGCTGWVTTNKEDTRKTNKSHSAFHVPLIKIEMQHDNNFLLFEN